MTKKRMRDPVCLTIVGARPQFIKAAPLSRALERLGVRELIVHTGQHYDHAMSQVFFDELGIRKPTYNLGIGSLSQGAQTGRMTEQIEAVLLKERPGIVLVYGDTNSTLAGALAAVKLHIPVAHVEAGLRSFNRAMPEEINRVMTDHVSDILFCPTRTAVRNLSKEGFPPSNGGRLVNRSWSLPAAAPRPLVVNVGDVMYDSVLHNRVLARNKAGALNRLGLDRKGYHLATIHRAENTDDPKRLISIFRAFASIGKKHPVVIPLHPRTRKLLGGSDTGRNVKLIDPVPYLEMLALTDNARMVLTDSGGLQKEACFLGVPCVTLRDETEWIETLSGGWNALAGASTAAIIETAGSQEARSRRPAAGAAFGDGNAAERIARILVDYSRRQ